VLEFGSTNFAVQQGGGKISEFRQATGSNLLAASGVNPSYAFISGSTLWTAPQNAWSWPPPTAVDSDNYTMTADETGASITAVQVGTPGVGPNVTVTKVFKANLCKEAVDITYTIRANAAAQFAPWEVARVKPGGLAFFPAGSRCGTATCGAKDTLVAPQIAVPTESSSQYFFYDQAANPSNDQKLFADGAGGWLAFTNGTDLYVQKWTDVPLASQAPAEREVEMYDGTTYEELEIQGPYVSLAAAASTSFQITWYVRPLPATASRTAGNQGLVDAVLALVQ
jgi:hypothetical protein